MSAIQQSFLVHCKEHGFKTKHKYGVGHVSRCKLLYIECINNRVLLYSTENYIQYPVINRNGRENEKERMYV